MATIVSQCVQETLEEAFGNDDVRYIVEKRISQRKLDELLSNRIEKEKGKWLE